ncbi:MAG: hypothetical protein Fur0022_10330 [Anaerolineales bacterium]
MPTSIPDVLIVPSLTPESPPEIPTLLPTPSAQGEATPTNFPTPEISPTPTTEVSSSYTTGPWLVIITPDGAWVVSAEDSTLARVVDVPILAPQDTFAMPAPHGGFAAFITGNSRLQDLTLHILTLPRNLTRTIPLTLPEYAVQADALPGDPALEAARALVELTSLAWAPDGSRLAFMGMREGPTSDLYTFSMDEFWTAMPEDDAEGLIRWTDGPSQGILPNWSPDGRYILHAGVNTLGTGAGYDMAGVWVVDTLTGEVQEVYTPADGAEIFVGWQDEDTFLVHSWSPVCGNENLRAVDIPSGEIRMIWDGAFNGVAFTREEGQGALLISVDQYLADCSPNLGPGLFLLFGPEYLGLDTIVSEEAFLPVWDAQARLFFARTADKVYAIEMDEDVIVIRPLMAPEPALPSASADGKLAWALRSGIWVGSLNTETVQIFASPASLPIWSPDGQTLFFVAEEGLYAAHAPEFVPQLIGEGLLGTGAFWVQP